MLGQAGQCRHWQHMDVIGDGWGEIIYNVKQEHMKGNYGKSVWMSMLWWDKAIANGRQWWWGRLRAYGMQGWWGQVTVYGSQCHSDESIWKTMVMCNAKAYGLQCWWLVESIWTSINNGDSVWRSINVMHWFQQRRQEQHNEWQEMVGRYDRKTLCEKQKTLWGSCPQCAFWLALNAMLRFTISRTSNNKSNVEQQKMHWG
jgi:hypothetical protein